MTHEEKIDYIISQCWFAEDGKVGFAEIVNLLDEETNVVLINISSRATQVKYKDDRFYDILPKLALKWGEFVSPLEEQSEDCVDFICDLLKQYETDKKVYTAN